MDLFCHLYMPITLLLSLHGKSSFKLCIAFVYTDGLMFLLATSLPQRPLDLPENVFDPLFNTETSRLD